MAESRTVRVLVALLFAMAFATFALWLFEKASPMSLTRADLMALNPQIDFSTDVPMAEWKNIVVFASADSDMVGVAHFVVETNNGRPVVRTTDLWRQQADSSKARPGSACVAVGIKGDFSKKPPTAAQLRELANLTTMLQQLSHIPPRNVSLHDTGPAFPNEKFRNKLLR